MESTCTMKGTGPITCRQWLTPSDLFTRIRGFLVFPQWDFVCVQGLLVHPLLGECGGSVWGLASSAIYLFMWGLG